MAEIRHYVVVPGCHDETGPGRRTGCAAQSPPLRLQPETRASGGTPGGDLVEQAGHFAFEIANPGGRIGGRRPVLSGAAAGAAPPHRRCRREPSPPRRMRSPVASPSPRSSADCRASSAASHSASANVAGAGAGGGAGGKGSASAVMTSGRSASGAGSAGACGSASAAVAAVRQASAAIGSGAAARQRWPSGPAAALPPVPG